MLPVNRHVKAQSLKSRSTLAARIFTVLAAGIAAAALAVAPLASYADTTPGTGWLPDQLASWSTITDHTSTAAVSVTNGVEYSTESIAAVDGTVPIRLLNVDTQDPNVKVHAVVSHDTVMDGADETVSSMASRTGAVAGINGGYFQINASGQANDGEIVDGEIWKSPTKDHEGTFAINKNGNPVFGTQTFSGTITAADGNTTHDLASINWTSDAQGDGITEVTPRLGNVSSAYNGGTHVLILGTSGDGGSSIKVTQVETADALTALPTGTYGLLGSVAGEGSGAWLRSHVKVGDTISVSHHISPTADIQQLVQGPGLIVKDGQTYSDPHNQEPSGKNPETVVGATKDGHVVMATLDGRKTKDVAIGPTVAQTASYLESKGVTNAVLLDGGGSTEMVARRPGDTQVSVSNTPSDGNERPVANGIFVSSTETSAGRAQSAHLNGGTEISTAPGVSTAVPAYVTDAEGNPATRDAMRVAAEPASLGTWKDGTFTAGTAGTGKLVLTAGDVSTSVNLSVADSFASLSMSPDAPDLADGGTQQLSLTGKDAAGRSVTVKPASAKWDLSRSDLGSIDAATGMFTAAASGDGVVTVTATAGGKSASTSIGVGSTSQSLAAAEDPSTWSVSKSALADKAFHASADVPSGSSQKSSIALHYAFPDNASVHQAVFWPNGDISMDKDGQGRAPTAVTLKVKLDDPAPTGLQFALGIIQGNGQSTNIYVPISADQTGKWMDVSFAIPSGSVFPLTLNYLDLLNTHATGADSGTMTVAGLYESYPARTISAPAYVAIPSNPDWLTYEESAADFSQGGTTLLLGDDGHLLANDPGSSSALNLQNMVKRVNGETYQSASGQTVSPLPSVAEPSTVVSLGDIADNAQIENLQSARNAWQAFGKPLYDVVGNHEITQGAVPENTNFHSVFQQDTHFAFRSGQSTFIAVDNAHGTITGSDSDQVPAEQQFPWLVKQLDEATTPVVLVGIHMPAYDPAPNKASQFSDRWEAKQFLEVIQKYRQAHPDKHVLVMYGHSRGFTEQMLDPDGNDADATTGIPQLTFGDIGMPAYKAADQGGFYHFGLLHIGDDGKVQFTVEPALKSVTIDQGVASAQVDTATTTGSIRRAVAESTTATTGGTVKVDSLQTGESKQYSATAVNNNGDNDKTPPTMPVTDPLSHVWASSNPEVATVDRVTGKVMAKAAGVTTISVESGGITSDLELSVTESPAPGGNGNTGGGDQSQNGSGNGLYPTDRGPSSSGGPSTAKPTGTAAASGHYTAQGRVTGNGKLARTGSSAWSALLPIGIGVLLLMSGGVALALGRRRRMR
jgi:exopolysaccharide biosynthesis protein